MDTGGVALFVPAGDAPGRSLVETPGGDAGTAYAGLITRGADVVGGAGEGGSNALVLPSPLPPHLPPPLGSAK
eukprot:38255-Heterocapsa_arctica.AAC.1